MGRQEGVEEGVPGPGGEAAKGGGGQSGQPTGAYPRAADQDCSILLQEEKLC